jgi:hypothetical protein
MEPEHSPNEENLNDDDHRSTRPGNAPTLAPVDSDVDPLLLAWYLVLDFKAEFTLLTQLDATRYREAIDKLSREAGFMLEAPWEQKLARADQHLRSKHGHLEPNALWIAWVRNLRTSHVATLQQFPTTTPAPAQEQEAEHEGKQSSTATDDVDPESAAARNLSTKRRPVKK